MVDYVTVAEVTVDNNIDTTKYNDKIETIITDVSALIDVYCKRPEGFLADSTATAKTFAGTGTAIQRIPECTEITLVAVKNSVTDTTYTSWTSSDWIAFRGSSKRPNYEPVSMNNPKPYTGLQINLAGNYSVFTSGLAEHTRPGFRPPIDRPILGFGNPTVQVTAKWGYATATPALIKRACLIEIARWLGRSEAGWTDTLASSDFQERRVSQGLDPATIVLLDKGGFRKPMGW